MKKAILSLAMLAMCGSVLADALQDKVNSYNALRANKPNTPVLDVRGLLRNEAGVTSSNPGALGNTCAICGLTSGAPERPGGGGSLPANDPTNTGGNTGSGSVLDRVPTGLGVPPPAIVRTPDGTGASWQSPSPEQDYRFAGYESQYTYFKQQYDAQVASIINSYMDPNSGKLAQARVALINAVEVQVAQWTAAHPGSSVADRARMESAFIAANSGAIDGLVTSYQSEISRATNAFNTAMNWARQTIESPVDNSGGA